MLKVVDLETYIEQYHILQGVTFDVQPGEITVLFGRNGAGKTTTLRTIMGYYPIARGAISYKNEQLNGLPTHLIARKGIGHVPEDQGIFQSLTVGETLILAQRDKSFATNEKLEWMLEVFPDLKKFWTKRSSLLSGGQKQMLAIARAYISSNGLLLIDEPSKGLSPIMVEKLMESILQMKEKTTILLVEQNYYMASTIGDYFYIMDEGKIVHSGPMDALLEDQETSKKYLGIS